MFAVLERAGIPLLNLALQDDRVVIEYALTDDFDGEESKVEKEFQKEFAVPYLLTLVPRPLVKVRGKLRAPEDKFKCQLGHSLVPTPPPDLV